MKNIRIKIFVAFIVFLIILIFWTLNKDKVMKSYALPDNWYENYTYILDDTNNIITLTKYNGSESEIEVPSTVTISEKNYNVLINGGVYEGNKNIKSVVFANGVKTGTTLRRLFYGCNNLEIIEFNGLKTENVTSMSSMFQNCKSIKKLDLSSFDTSKVTSMYNMFYSCSSLNELNISSFNTYNLINMSGMFYGLSSLKSLDISSFDTTNVENLSNTFNLLSKITEFKLGKKTNLKVNVNEAAGNFSRGSWIRVEDNKEFSAVDIGLLSTTSQGAAGVYKRKSSISSEINVDFPVTYKLEKISHIDEFKKSPDSDFYITSDRSVKINIPLSKSKVYSVPGSIELVINDAVSDENEIKYNLKIKISNIKLYDLDVLDGLSSIRIEIVSINNGFIAFNHTIKDPDTGADKVINNNGVSRIQDVEMQIIDDNGVVKNGDFIFSVYDLDLASVQDSGYGIYSEGINLISGFDINDIKLSSPSFLSISNLPNSNYKRITGSRPDNESESSEFAVKASASGAKFQWTAGKMCSTKLFSYYQPKLVEILKTTFDSEESIEGIGLELYRDSQIINSWKTTKESKKIFLNPGKYILKEVSKPSIYTQAKDIEFYVDINDSITVDGKSVEKVVMVNDYKETKVVEKHIYEKENKLLGQNEYVDKIGSSYKTDSKFFDGYKLVKVPNNATGIMTEEPIEVVYYYRKVFNVITSVVGSGGIILGDEEVFEGDSSTPSKILITPNDNFIIESITINGKKVEITDENGMTLDNFENMIEDKMIVVTFKPAPMSKVIEKHIDEYSNEVLDIIEHKGKIGDLYKTSKKEYSNYQLVKNPLNYTGMIQENVIEVVYYYKKIFNIKTMVDGVGGIIVGDEEVLEGNSSTPSKIVITPDDGFVIETITINNQKIEVIDKEGMVLSNFENVLEDKNVVVSFAQILADVPNTNRTSNILVVSSITCILGVMILIYFKKIKLKGLS